MNPWLAVPGPGAPRRPILESWERARRRRLDPDRVEASLDLAGDELADYRLAHPLALALPVIRRLLVRDADEGSGVVVAVGDAAGRLLWVEGDPALKRRAEGMRFMEGARWAERDVGTSAPGTALALDHGIQVTGREHFATPVQRWSCTAVPVHDLRTHEVLGVLDVTGGDDAVAPHVLPLLEATAAAVERELLVQRLTTRRRRRQPTARAARTPRLAVLGTDTGTLSTGSTTVTLSARHAELMTLLAWHRAGLPADLLADQVFGRASAVGTVRAEMVRLRHLLQSTVPSLTPLARPYRLPAPVDLDARIVIGLLDRGAHAAALAAYPGAVLPDSDAPGIDAIRVEVAARMRESMLESASAEVLLQYARTAAGSADPQVWEALLHLLPARSPRRAGVVAHLETIA